MISSLRLKNVALIGEAEIEFGKGLNVISGETGSGKTVLIGAINFLLGAKADKSMIRYGETSCFCEGSFTDVFVKDILDEYGIDDEGDLIIRRRFFSDGRGDIRVNGVTVTASALKKLSERLCDVYGQSEHYSLISEKNQLAVLDAFIGNNADILKEKIKTLVSGIKELENSIKEFGGAESDRAVKCDLLSYQINEIENAEIKEGEEEELSDRRKIFLNTEKIGNALSAAKSFFTEDNAASDLINNALREAQSVSDLSKEYSDLTDRLYTLKSDAEDVVSSIENALDGLDFDGDEFKLIDDRLDLIKNIKKKYGNTVEEINDFYEKAKKEYEFLVGFEEKRNEISSLISEKKNALFSLYNELDKLRNSAAEDFSEKVKKELRTLGMNSADFKIAVNKTDYNLLPQGGANTVEFLFSANAGEPLKTMSKVISGGETSRFMLAMKLVDGVSGGTYVFDEIDAGISGAIAGIVAKKFCEISQKSQIITISHLPQIVSYADESFKIAKHEEDGRTFTTVTALDEFGKRQEIIRLIGGDISIASEKHAEELIKSANEYKTKINSLK